MTRSRFATPSGREGAARVPVKDDARHSSRPSRHSRVPGDARVHRHRGRGRRRRVRGGQSGKDFSADSNGTKRYALTEHESAGLAKLFDSVDVDGSGAVDYLELASFLRAMSTLDDDLAAAISPKMVYEVFRRSDDDGDGRAVGR